MTTCSTSGLKDYMPSGPPEAVYMGWTSGTGFISKMIQRLDWSLVNGKRTRSGVNHVFWVFDWGNGPRLVYESHLDGGIQITPWQHIQRACVSGKIDWIAPLKKIEIDPMEGLRLWNRCVKRHHQNYNLGMIFRYYWWIRVLKKRKKDRFPKFLKTHDTCNTFCIGTGDGDDPIASEDIIRPNDYSQTPEELFKNAWGTPSYLVRYKNIVPARGAV